jgi:hypothetical protein
MKNIKTAYMIKDKLTWVTMQMVRKNNVFHGMHMWDEANVKRETNINLADNVDREIEMVYLLILNSIRNRIRAII